MNGLKKINEKISYLPACEEPLSADVFVISGREFTWIYDVGNCPQALEVIQSLEGPVKVVLSHFHSDHTGNLEKAGLSDVYAGANTLKYTKIGIPVTEDIYIDDGVKIHLFPLPSSHAKGSVGLEVDETYTFLGDGIYPQDKNGDAVYNVQMLHDEIETLKALKSTYLLISHRSNPIYPKALIIKKLESTYEKRAKNQPYIKQN